MRGGLIVLVLALEDVSQGQVDVVRTKRIVKIERPKTKIFDRH